MLVVTYGPLYKPKFVTKEYDIILEGYGDRKAAEAMYKALKDENDDVYIEEGRAYVPMIRGYAFSSLDYSLVYIPRSRGINIYVPKDKLQEFLEFLREYNDATTDENTTLKGFIMDKLKDRKIPYLYPSVALYYDKYIYLYLSGIEVVLPAPNV